MNHAEAGLNLSRGKIQLVISRSQTEVSRRSKHPPGCDAAVTHPPFSLFRFNDGALSFLQLITAGVTEDRGHFSQECSCGIG